MDITLPYSEYGHNMFTAARWGAKQSLIELINDGGIINARGGSLNRTALHEACMSNHFEIATILIEHGANIESFDEGGWTPLHCAVHHAGVECASVLMDYGANIWKKQYFRYTPIHWCNDFNMFSLLISRGMDVSRPRSETELAILHSVLNDAIRDGKLETVRMLLYDIIGIDIKRKNARGICAILSAKRCKHASTKQLIGRKRFEIKQARREMCVSFAMGSAKRLGYKSHIQSLDEGVVEMILRSFLEI
jgi:ankyrin repeat protein